MAGWELATVIIASRTYRVLTVLIVVKSKVYQRRVLYYIYICGKHRRRRVVLSKVNTIPEKSYCKIEHEKGTGVSVGEVVVNHLFKIRHTINTIII